MDSGGRATNDFASQEPTALLDGLLRVSQIVRMRFNDWLSRFELNDGRHAVLVALTRENEMGCSQADLAESLGLSESNISTLIERMQRVGLVSRSRSDADRRKRVLRITSEGQAALAAVDLNRSSWAGCLLRGIPADDMPRLLNMLQQLGASIEPTLFVASPASTSLSARHEVTPPNDPEQSHNTGDDPQSPQVAIRRMLLELSSSATAESRTKDAA